MPCFSSFAMMLQTHDVINIVVMSRFMHPAFCISIPIQHMLKFILTEYHTNILRH